MIDACPTYMLEIGRSFEPSFTPVLDTDGWRVAMLRSFEVVSPANFHRVERHLATDEIFVLTDGRADLVVMGNDTMPHSEKIISLERNVAYNVKRAVWHHVLMSSDAHIILFERSDTGPANTVYATIDPAHAAVIVRHLSFM